MAELSLTVEKREVFGKGPAGRLRRGGKLPGVLYGDGKDPVPLTVDAKALEEILSSPTGVNTIFDLELVGTKQRRPVMIHDYQRHPILQNVEHVDFLRVNMQRKVSVKVALKLAGTPTGVKVQGGIVEFLHRDVELECLPADIPREIPVDISSLMVNQSVRVSELNLDAAKYRVLTEPGTVIVLVGLPAAEREAAKAEEGAVAAAPEPEVIKKGKEKEGKEAKEAKEPAPGQK